MHKLRLLERLKAWETGQISRFHQLNESELLESITTYLEKILNTKQGGAKLSPDFGVPEFHDLTGDFVEKEIQHVISKYEPRFEVNNVTRMPLDNKKTATVEISITGNIKGSKDLLRFTTVLTSNGRVTVKL